MPIAANIMACPNIGVPMEIMQRLVSVESARNPFAIGVVGAKLERQPENLAEAVATANMLESQGYNFSVGISQVNRHNFAKYGLANYEKSFDVCTNLNAGARILTDCYNLAGGDWGKSLSCYYSGNFTKGFEDGYVQKIYSAAPTPTLAPAQPIAIMPTAPSQSQPAVITESPAQYRARIRSTALNNMAPATATRSLPIGPTSVSTPMLENPPTLADSTEDRADVSVNSEVFTPHVSGPNGATMPINQAAKSAKTTADRADIRLGAPDEAFVF